MSKRQQSLAREKRSGQTEALHCLNSTLSAPAGWAVKEDRARLCVWGLQRPACCQAPSCENRIVVCVAESAAAQAFAKSAWVNFYFCFLPLASDMASAEGPAFCTTRSLACCCRRHLVLRECSNVFNPYLCPPIALIGVDTNFTFIKMYLEAICGRHKCKQEHLQTTSIFRRTW